MRNFSHIEYKNGKRLDNARKEDDETDEEEGHLCQGQGAWAGN